MAVGLLKVWMNGWVDVSISVTTSVMGARVGSNQTNQTAGRWRLPKKKKPPIFFSVLLGCVGFEKRRGCGCVSFENRDCVLRKERKEKEKGGGGKKPDAVLLKCEYT